MRKFCYSDGMFEFPSPAVRNQCVSIVWQRGAVGISLKLPWNKNYFLYNVNGVVIAQSDFTILQVESKSSRIWLPPSAHAIQWMRPIYRG